MRRRVVLVMLIVAAVVVVTVGVIAGLRAHAAGPATLTGHSWTLTRLVVSGQEQPLSQDHPPTLRLQPSDRTLSGSGGCNSYGASYTILGSSLHVGEMRSTLMACMDTTVMEQEAAFTRALSQIGSYHLDGDTLTLDGDGGRIVMTFHPSEDTVP